MKSIFSLIPVALFFAATTGFGASTGGSASAEPLAETAGSAGNAPVTSGAPSKTTAPDAGTITTDQILARLFGRRSDDLVKSGRGGSRLLDLQGRLSMVSIIVRNPDGTIGHYCVDNIKAATKLLAAPITPAPVPAAASASAATSSPIQ